MPHHNAAKGLPWDELHHLREQCLAYVHTILRVVETRKHRKNALAISNRGHPRILRNPTQYCTYSNRGVNQPDTSALRYAFVPVRANQPFSAASKQFSTQNDR